MSFIYNLTPLYICEIYELDSDGKISFYRMNANNGCADHTADLIGSNFFDIAGFKNVEAFRKRVKDFFQNSNCTEDFNFDCRFPENKSEKVKVRLVRVSERESGRSLKKVIVDIRKFLTNGVIYGQNL